MLGQNAGAISSIALLDPFCSFAHAMSMTTNAGGTQRRGPPPSPSARASLSTHGGGLATKNTGRLAQMPDPDETLVTSVHSTYPARSGGGSQIAQRGSQSLNATERNVSAPTHAPQNDPSRTLSQDMRREVQDIVRFAVERALAPQLERVRQLERDLTELRRERPKLAPMSPNSGASALSVDTPTTARAAAPVATATHAVVPTMPKGARAAFDGASATHAVASAVHTVATATPITTTATLSAVSHAPVAVNTTPVAATTILSLTSTAPVTSTAPATSTPSAAWSAPSEAAPAPRAPFAIERPTAAVDYSSAASAKIDLDDIAWELNGARRRKTVAWLFGVFVFLVLAAVCGAAILSNLNAH